MDLYGSACKHAEKMEMNMNHVGQRDRSEINLINSNSLTQSGGTINWTGKKRKNRETHAS